MKTKTKIPEDWEVVKLEYICEVNSGDTAPQDKEYFENGEIPFVRMQHLNDLEENKYVKNFDLISKKAVIDKKMKIFKKGSILLAKSGESIRTEKKAILKFDSCVVNHLAVLTIKDETKVDNEYLFYFFKKFMLSSLLTQTTTPSINLSVFRKLKIFLPSLPEQKAIAQILSTIDKAIQKVDEIIAKTERLKKGLMQQLLTKGIGHTEFKFSKELGCEIPKEWRVVKIGDILSLEYGKGLPEKERIQGKYPVIGSNGVIGYHNQALIKGPGVVVGRKGTIGAVSWIDQDFWPIDTTYYVKLKVTNVFLKWLFYELTYLNPARFHLADVVPGLKRELVYCLKIPLPLTSEQQKIAEILSTIDKKLELERKRKEKLEKIKKGLMNDLLTGKKRVNVEKVLALGGENES
jgi:type I restriction enzyme S subunit